MIADARLADWPDGRLSFHSPLKPFVVSILYVLPDIHIADAFLIWIAVPRPENPAAMMAIGKSALGGMLMPFPLIRLPGVLIKLASLTTLYYFPAVNINQFK